MTYKSHNALLDYLVSAMNPNSALPVLDLACGKGRSGLILGAVKPGGMAIYETFTTENRRYGRPNNPDFLLKPGELSKVFNEWQQIHYFEGVQQDPDRAVAQVIAKKPSLNS